jgi:hypothetical protein
MAISDEPARKSLESAPEPTAFDYGLAVAKVGAVAFPFLGSGIALFDLITAPIRGKRFNDWCERLRLGLNELSQKVAELTPEKLAASEEFNSAFTQAAQAAMKTHLEEKLEALRNAVLNVAVGDQFSIEQQGIFLSLVDSSQLQPVHLRTLRILAGLALTDKSTLSNVLAMLQEADAGLRDLGNEGTTVVLQDLQSCSFIKMTAIVINNSSPFALTEGFVITLWGRAFLSFISMPAGSHKMNTFLTRVRLT